MGQIIQLWFQRSDAESVVLYSPPMDASSAKSISLLLNINAINAGSTATVVAEQSLDPTNPNSWSTTGTPANGGAIGNFPGLAGGVLAGTTVPLGPWVRLRATLVVAGGGGGITWSAAAVMRD
jgi:hypothetical protein